MQTETAEKFTTPKARFDRGALPQFRAFASNARTALADASGADRAAIAAELASLEQRLVALRELADGKGTFEHRKADLAQHRAEWERVRGTAGPVEDAAIVQLSEAVSRLLLTPAPDLPALAFKFRVFAEYEVHESLIRN